MAKKKKKKVKKKLKKKVARAAPKKSKKRKAVKRKLKKRAKQRGRSSKKVSSRKGILKEKEERKEKKGGLDEFVKLGKQRGFVTEDEILHVIPEVEKNVAELEKLYEKLELAGVKVISSDEVIREEIDREAEKEKKVEDIDVPLDLDDISSDSVQMYLREIGRVPLLTAEDEVHLAKRIEKGDLAAKQKLTEANLRLVV